MKFKYLAAAVLATIAPASAQAGVYIFNGVCANTATTTQAACTSTNGSYGNTVTLNSTTSSSVQVKISAWQMNQNGGAVTSAFLGAYGGGFGVTGVQDQNGGGNLHQIDNVNGYTDFVMLQFNTAVHLDSVNANVYGINNVYDADASFSNASAIGINNVYDADASFSNASAIAPASWNANMTLSTYAGTWSNTASAGASGQYSTTLTNSTSGFSKVWLVSASQLTADRNDGFKLSSISVTTPAGVPEPATWAMMIMGFGFIGASLRRRNAGQLLTA